MKLHCKLTILGILYLINNVTCNTYQIWQPKYLKDVLSNTTEEFGNQIIKKTEFIENTFTNYVDAAKRQKDNVQKSIGGLFQGTKDRISKTLDYFTNKNNAETEIENATVINLLNDEQAIQNKPNPDVYLDTVQLIAKNGYPAESHTVKTEDGYLLTMHRIPHAKEAPDGTFGHQAVLLQHGILGSSSNFVTGGAEKGLAYILAEAGYDVWMGNFRGNTYSRSHISITVKDPMFWNFTWHESAMYDLPAKIDYINSIKKTNDLLYIGHSMGTTTLFALLSTRLEYNAKVKAAFAMAPIAYMTNVRSPIKYLAPFADNIQWITMYLGADEFIPQSVIFKWLANIGCEINRYSEDICRNLLFLVAGFDPKQFNKQNFPVILSHTPAGTSTKTVIHFAQEIRDSGKFRQYDYGSDKNMQIYGQNTPPEYPVEKITLPIALLWAANDLLSSFEDSQALYKQLQNPIEYYKVPMEEFNHLDFLWGIDAPTLVYDRLLTLMKTHNTYSKFLWSIPMLNFEVKGRNDEINATFYLH